MEQKNFNLEFQKVMKRLSSETAPSYLNFERDFYKRLWNFFLIGDSYYFILNHQSLMFEFVSKEVEDVMGYHPSEFNIQFMNSKIHPDDRTWFLGIGSRIA